ncbi:hypothetical protein SAMN02745866_04144 [Alteromonadaceae bacterium Bs31]|nr:hypothetical protein SAMN02745866_04144 [Alteromonadaceae bacterium Bs31]
MKTLRLLILAGSLLAWMHVQAQVSEICPAVACDCGSLPLPEWKATCADFEKAIKKSCAANGNSPIDYCSIHGPSAKPLPLAVTFSNLAVLSLAGVEAKHSSVAVLYWSVHKDIDTLKKKVSALFFKEGLELVSVMDRNIDTLFDTQRQVTMSWLVYEQEKEATAAWKMYSDDTLKMSDNLAEYGDELWQAYKVTENPGAKKAYKILAFKVWRLSGKAYEMSAYAYSGSDKNKNAASAWAKGADVAKSILNAKQETKAKPSHINFYRYQAASRLHRASYHFALLENSEDALQMLSQASEISPGNELLALIAKEENAEAADLTGID